LVSSLQDRPLPRSLVAFGELGLTGELRPVAYGEERLREAHKQGFTRALVARDNAPRKALAGFEVLVAGRVSEALAAAFSLETELAILSPAVQTPERS
jgi:DNA repair protein RadA/Sms